MNEQELVAFLKKNLKVVVEKKTDFESITITVAILLSEEVIHRNDLSENLDKVISMDEIYIYKP